MRPFFSFAWAAAQRIYDPSNSSAKVAQMIGGNVALNINSSDPTLRWTNTCAVRMSYILNESGMLIPPIMSRYTPLAVVALIVSLFTPVYQAQNQIRNSPQAGSRTYSVNYKDMVLATCIATAYKDDPGVAKDAGSSVSALRDWTSFDLDQATGPIHDLVTDYLSRDYHNPIVESEVP